MLLEHSSILHLQVQPVGRRELVRREECATQSVPHHTHVLATVSKLSRTTSTNTYNLAASSHCCVDRLYFLRVSPCVPLQQDVVRAHP